MTAVKEYHVQLLMTIRLQILSFLFLLRFFQLDILHKYPHFTNGTSWFIIPTKLGFGQNP